MKKLIGVILSMLFLAGISYLAVAGSIDSPGAPSAGSGMYTLLEIYDYLNSGTVAPTPGPFQMPGAGPGSTMKSLKEIYGDIKAKIDQCGATAADVKTGKTFFSTLSGSWGVQTGTWVTPTPTNTPTNTPTITPIPTNTPTLTPTPTSTPTKTWYEQYGPSGTGDVVQIGSMYVAGSYASVGCAGGGALVWNAALLWADGLVWLGKDDWRLPTGDSYGEIVDICAVRNTTPGFTYSAGWYDSSTGSGSYNFWKHSFTSGACTQTTGNKTMGTNYVRVVRP